MRVILCDDHKSLTAALADALRRLGHEIVLIADRPDQALSAAAETSVDVVVMDLAFPTGDGFAAAEALRRLPSAPQVFVLTARTDRDAISLAIQAGASGLLTRQAALDDLVSTLEKVAAGGIYYDAQVLRDAFVPAPLEVAKARQVAALLTPREREVLERSVRGESTSSMAAAMGISVNTLRSHVRAMLAKLNAHSRLEAVAWAISHHVVEPPSAEASASDHR
jgi:two-component system, NarL family, nitrate/nitrite response regulator NarL